MVEMVESQDPMGALGASHVTCSGEIGATLLSGSVATSEMPRVRAENGVVRPTSGNRLAVDGSKAKDGLAAPLKSDSCAGDKRNEAEDDEFAHLRSRTRACNQGLGRVIRRHLKKRRCASMLVLEQHYDVFESEFHAKD